MTDEYQQVAAILVSDIDILAKLAKQPQWDATDLRMLIKRLAVQKDQITTDAKVRESRYNAMRNIANLPRPE